MLNFGFRPLRRADELLPIVAAEICAVRGGATPLGQLFSKQVPRRNKAGQKARGARHRSIIVHSEPERTLCYWQESQREGVSKPSGHQPRKSEIRRKTRSTKIVPKQEVSEPELQICNLARSCWNSRTAEASPATVKSVLQLARGTEALREELESESLTLQLAQLESGRSSPTSSKVSWGAVEGNRLARSYNLSISEVRKAHRMFEKYDIFGMGKLDHETYHCMLQDALQEWLPGADPDQYITSRDQKSSGEDMTFEDFVLWTSLNSFKADTQEQELRKIAEKYDVSMLEIDTVKRRFDELDTDGSRHLDIDEFKTLLERLLKVPRGTELPQNRTMNMWREMDRNGDGKIEFTEFLPWYLRNFAQR